MLRIDRGMLIAMVAGAAAAGGATSEVPTSAAVIAAARAAAGGPAVDRLRVVRASGREHAYGLDGQWLSSVSMADGRFRAAEDFGIFTSALAFDGSTEWRADRSAGVHPLDGAFGRRRAITDAWLARLGYLRQDAAGAALGHAARRERDGRTYDVLTATPRSGQPVELWFDAGTHLLAIDTRRDAISTRVERLEDYRPVGGVRLPFRISTSDDDGSDARDVAVATYELKAIPGTRDFARPSTSADWALARPTTVPVEIGSYVVVEARLNGRGPFAFILDTGGHSILTPAAVQALGLTPVGASTSGGAGAGTLAQQDVLVYEMRIGEAALRRQHFYVIPLQYATVERGSRAPLAGIIGAELLERLVARIDYRGSRLTLAPPRQAEALCRGARVPISFDDDIPLVDGEVDGKAGVLAIDSGNGGSTVVQGVWAERVGLIPRLRGGIETTSFGAGGASTNWVTHGGGVVLGHVAVRNVDLRLATDGKGAFSSITEAANVGQQVLGRFDVTFDYFRRRMCLSPRPGYTPPPLGRSGLSLLKQDADTFRVVSVARGSAGENAGVRAGDDVIAVDDRKARLLSGQDAGALMRQAPGTAVRLVLVRAGQTLQSTIVLKDPG